MPLTQFQPVDQGTLEDGPVTVIDAQDGSVLDEQELTTRQLKKSNSAIMLRAQSGKLSLLARKTFNVLISHAQKQRKPGVNMPAGVKRGDGLFWVPLAELAFDASYASNDTQLLKDTVEELQNVRVIIEDDTQWSSDHLVQKVIIYKPDGLRKRGGSAVWVGYSFPTDIEDQVFRPEQYTRLSLFYQGQFRSAAALVLYEYCRRYLGNPSKLTGALDLQWAYSYITGSQDGMPEYKYFKRDTLNPSIAEINATSDILIELVEIRKGRRVGLIQFRVEHAIQNNLPFSVGPMVDTELVALLEKDLRLSHSDARDVVDMNDPDKVRQAYVYVRERMRKPGGGRINSVVAYFKKALKEGYALDSSAPTPAEPVKKREASGEDAMAQILRQYNAERAQEAWGLYNEKSREERAQDLERFMQSDSYAGMAASAKRTITSKRMSGFAQSVFSQWLAKLYWADPTTDDLLQYSAQRLLAAQSARS